MRINAVTVLILGAAGAVPGCSAQSDNGRIDMEINVAIRNSLWFGMVSSGTQKLAAINIQRNQRDRNIQVESGNWVIL
jgi:hypothetical protein